MNSPLNSINKQNNLLQIIDLDVIYLDKLQKSSEREDLSSWNNRKIHIDKNTKVNQIDKSKISTFIMNLRNENHRKQQMNQTITSQNQKIIKICDTPLEIQQPQKQKLKRNKNQTTIIMFPSNKKIENYSFQKFLKQNKITHSKKQIKISKINLSSSHLIEKIQPTNRIGSIQQPNKYRKSLFQMKWRNKQAKKIKSMRNKTENTEISENQQKLKTYIQRLHERTIDIQNNFETQKQSNRANETKYFIKNTQNLKSHTYSTRQSFRTNKRFSSF